MPTMCGRFALTDDEAALMAFLGFGEGSFGAGGFGEAVAVAPRYNIAPTQPIAIVRVEGGRRQFTFARWGLAPAWVEDPRAFSLLINARADGVLDKPAFKNAMRYRRCLVPASGFYEWQRRGRSKQPYWIRPRESGPMAFAGLWETWADKDGGEIDSACIITVDANATVRPIHDRMPAIVDPADFDRWLNSPEADEAAALLKPAPDDLLEAFQVSNRVNRADDDDPGLIAPVAKIRADLFDL
jgi:putative SOS response-associated peptidase YedK